jgi:hypothetical protein
MRRTSRDCLSAGVAILLSLTPCLVAQDVGGIPVAEIIQKFAAKESEAKAALAGYLYTQDVVMQELDGAGNATGEYHALIETALDKKGKRTQKVKTVSVTLKRIGVTDENIQDIVSTEPFPITSDNVKDYDVRFTAETRINKISCYEFEAQPRQIIKNQRYFQGKLWVDKNDFHVVGLSGKTVPDIRQKHAENLFPMFDAYRELVEGF